MNRCLWRTRQLLLPPVCTRGGPTPPAPSLCPASLCHLAGPRGMHTGLKAEYEALVAAEKLRFDPHQLRAVEKLEALQRRLDGYEPPLAQGALQRVSWCGGDD